MKAFLFDINYYTFQAVVDMKRLSMSKTKEALLLKMRLCMHTTKLRIFSEGGDKQCDCLSLLPVVSPRYVLKPALNKLCHGKICSFNVVHQNFSCATVDKMCK